MRSRQPGERKNDRYTHININIRSCVTASTCIKYVLPYYHDPSLGAPHLPVQSRKLRLSPEGGQGEKIADFFGVSLNWLLSPEDDTDKPLPFDPEPLKEIKSRYYLRRALENSGIGEDKIPEALEELQRILRLLVRWSGKS